MLENPDGPAVEFSPIILQNASNEDVIRFTSVVNPNTGVEVLKGEQIEVYWAYVNPLNILPTAKNDITVCWLGTE